MKVIKLPSAQESGIPQQEYDTAIAGLIDKGLVEMGEIDGKAFFYLNKIGIMISENLKSNSKILN